MDSVKHDDLLPLLCAVYQLLQLLEVFRIDIKVTLTFQELSDHQGLSKTGRAIKIHYLPIFLGHCQLFLYRSGNHAV